MTIIYEMKELLVLELKRVQNLGIKNLHEYGKMSQPVYAQRISKTPEKITIGEFFEFLESFAKASLLQNPKLLKFYKHLANYEDNTTSEFERKL